MREVAQTNKQMVMSRRTFRRDEISMNGQTTTVTSFSVWGSAYLLASGIPWVGNVPGKRVGFTFSDEDGRARRLLQAWRDGDAMVRGPALADAYQEIMNAVKNNKKE
jgi:hypothetical protein